MTAGFSSTAAPVCRASPTPDSPMQVAVGAFCTSCGSPVERTWGFCARCGALVVALPAHGTAAAGSPLASPTPPLQARSAHGTSAGRRPLRGATGPPLGSPMRSPALQRRRPIAASTWDQVPSSPPSPATARIRPGCESADVCSGRAAPSRPSSAASWRSGVPTRPSSAASGRSGAGAVSTASWISMPLSASSKSAAVQPSSPPAPGSSGPPASRALVANCVAPSEKLATAVTAGEVVACVAGSVGDAAAGTSGVACSRPQSASSTRSGRPAGVAVSFRGVFGRMLAAVNAHFRAAGVQCLPTTPWPKLFRGSDHITFEEFDSTLHGISSGRISRYDTRIVWARLNEDQGSIAKATELFEALHRGEVDLWPDLDQNTLFRIIAVLTGAADKWHNFGGNWIKVFRGIDADGNDSLTFHEFRYAIRERPPGMFIRVDQVSEAELRGFWKCLDADRSGTISVQEFTSFMRQRTPKPPPKDLAHAAHKRQVLRRRDVGCVPHRTSPELKNVAAALDKGLQWYWASRGAIANTIGQWSRLFQEESSATALTKFTWLDFQKAVVGVVMPHVEGEVTLEDIYSFWCYIDIEDVGEVCVGDLLRAMLRLDLEDTEELDEAGLQMVLEEMDVAMRKWHRAEGNWYKMFNIATNGNFWPNEVTGRSGRMELEDLRRLLRSGYPSLGIPKERISDGNLLSLWKALDQRRLGYVTVQDFMRLMRKQCSMTQPTQYSKHWQETASHKRDILEDVRLAPALTEGRLLALGCQLFEGLDELLQSLGVSGTQDQLLSCDQFQVVAAEIMQGSTPVDSEELKALWRHFDEKCVGSVSVRHFRRATYLLSWASSPRLSDDGLASIAGLMDRAAQRWHGAGGDFGRVLLQFGLPPAAALTFADLAMILRCEPPGLALRPGTLPNEALRGLWRRLDSGAEGAARSEWLAGFVQHYSRESFARFADDALARPPSRKLQQLESPAAALQQTVESRAAAYGVPLYRHWDDVSSMSGACDETMLRKLTLSEWLLALEEWLSQPWCESAGRPRSSHEQPAAVKDFAGQSRPPVAAEDLMHLAALADDDCDGLLSAADWRLCLCRLVAPGWPVASKDQLVAIVKELEAAAARLHGAQWSWEHVFAGWLHDGSELRFDELCRFVRCSLPRGLAVPEQVVSDDALRSFWKALDCKTLLQVPARCLLQALRQHGRPPLQLQQARRPPSARLRKRWPAALPFPLAGGGAAAAAAKRAAARGRAVDVPALGDRERMLLSEALAQTTLSAFADAFQDWGLPWRAHLTEFDLILVVRRLLKLTERDISDDQVFSLWLSMKGEEGWITIDAFLALACR